MVCYEVINMRHYKIIDGDYLIAIGTGSGGEEITVEEYDGLKAVIGERPAAPEGYGHKLKTDLTWEEYELPPVVEEVDSETALKEIMEALG